MRYPYCAPLGWLRSSLPAAGLALLICLGAVQSSVEAAIICVSKTGADTRDGHDWDNAKGTVGGGLAAAIANDQVWVAAGTYVERIMLKDGVALYGGFVGSEPPDFDLSLRDFASHPSILDGNSGGSVVTALSGVTASARIDGFTIRNGHSDSGGGINCYYASPAIANNLIVGNYASSGGGICCDHCSSVILNNTIIGNTASWGGGIECWSASPAISNNRIAGNSGWSFGGGICCESTSPAAISNNTIVRNSSTNGGGVHCDSSSPAIWNNLVAFNSSGVRNASGGAPTLSHNCIFNPGGANYSGLSAGTGDISVDPQLLAVDGCELHLKASSPCIDAGDDTVVQPGWVDMDGQPRIQGGPGAHVDIGVDEFNGTTPPFAPKAVRVSLLGNNANDGSTWALAKRTVQAGMDAAATAGGADVWVAAGTYSERITLKAWAQVYGGFAGTESSRDQRDWTANATVLDGGAGGSVVTAMNNGYGPTSRIDGFTIRNGTGSWSGLYGGGVYCSASSPAISNNVITGNSAGSAGGGVYCKSSSPSLPAIFNNTIVGNSASMGGGIYCQSCTPVVSNNIVAFNSSGLYQSGGTPLLRNNCAYNPGGTNYSGLSPGAGDISVDPLFVNRPASNYRLAPGSPCIDAGYNAAVPAGTLIDLDGHVRMIDDPATPDCRWTPGNCGTAPIVDMGAYEFIPAIPGDYDGDGDVDVADLTVFQACVSGPGVAYAGECAKADLDPDGDVDQSDLGTFQRCYSGANRPADPNCAN